MASPSTIQPDAKSNPVVCVLGASFGTGNLGVSALAAGTVTSILHSFPDARVYLLDYGKEPAVYSVYCPGGTVSVELLNIRFSKKIFLRNNIAWLMGVALFARIIPVKSGREALLRKNPWLRHLLEADLVASLAGGDSFSDIYGMARLLYVSLPQILVLVMKKPLILLPQTIGPFKGRMAIGIAKFIVRRAQAVYSRDQTGYEDAARLLGPYKDKLKFSHDMAFVMEPAPPVGETLAQLPVRKEGTPLIGINVSGLLLMGGYSGNNMFGLKTDYVQLTRGLVDYFAGQQNATVLLVPHVFGKHAESDTTACERVYEELQSKYGERLRVLRGNFNQHEIKYAIGQCDFFLGARMHACIAAISQCVPAVCLAYSRKFLGVMDSIGCAELAVDLCTLDTDAALAAVRQIYEDRAKIRTSLQSRIPGVRQGVLALFPSSILKN